MTVIKNKEKINRNKEIKIITNNQNKKNNNNNTTNNKENKDMKKK